MDPPNAAGTPARTDTVVVVLPTYDERENITPILDAIRGQQGRIDGATLLVLVVDDRSPDGTGEVAGEYARRHGDVRLLSGPKKGLGTAYKRGLAYAIDTMAADIVFQMDADFSHDPDDIPRLLAALRRGSDLVVGSRYVPGGAIPENWSPVRKAMSRWGNVFARHIAGLRGVHDCTSGYRAIRVGVLRRIDVQSLAETGYAFLMSLLYEAVRSGAVVSEIPITFTDRVRGRSKLGIGDVAEFMLEAFRRGLERRRPPGLRR